MTAKPYKVYVIQGRTARDYSACQTAVATVPAHLETLPFLKNMVNPEGYAAGRQLRAAQPEGTPCKNLVMV